MALPARSETRKSRALLEKAAGAVRRARKLVKRAEHEAPVSDDKKIRRRAKASERKIDKAARETDALVDVWVERVEQSDE